MIILFANHKGGTGKTSTVLSLGTSLAKEGKKVLLVDLDAQCNLSDLALPGVTGRTIYDALTDRKSLPVIKTNEENLYLCPASPDLVAADLELYSKEKDFSSILRGLLEPIRKDFDFILLDTAPNLGLLVLNALVAADRLYITTTAEGLPIRGLKKLLEVSNKVKTKNPGLELGGVIITRWEGTTANKTVETTLRTHFKDKLLSTKIRKGTALVESQIVGDNILDYAPKSTVAKDYVTLRDEIFSNIK